MAPPFRKSFIVAELRKEGVELGKVGIELTGPKYDDEWWSGSLLLRYNEGIALLPHGGNEQEVFITS